MIANRELTPEEQEKHRRWQMEEILRRRGRPGHPFVEPEAEAKPKPKSEGPPGGPSSDAIEYKCPGCGTPYANRKYRRCYACHPGAGRVRTKPVEPVKPPPRRVSLDEAFARSKGPVVVPAAEIVAVVEPEAEQEYSPPIPECTPAIPEYSAQVRNIEVPVPDHLRVDPKMIEVAGNGKPVPPDPIAALRRVVDALDGLDRDAAKWVLQSAARLLRGQ